MGIELREGVFERTCCMVLVMGVGMVNAIKQMEKAGLKEGARQLKTALKLAEQGHMLEMTQAGLMDDFNVGIEGLD
jgi:hypothetical protein